MIEIEDEKLNIGIWMITIVGGVIGALSTAYCFFSMPVVIVWKLYRRVRFGVSVFD